MKKSISKNHQNPSMINFNCKNRKLRIIQEPKIKKSVPNRTEPYNQSVERTDNVHWELQDLNILNEVGEYVFNLTYSNNKNISLAENHTFKLTKLNYNVCEEVYIDNPFDVIRFNPDDIDVGKPINNVKVYVDGRENPYESGENPFRWTLNDLEIENAGEHDIRIEVYGYDELIERFTYTLNVDDSLNSVRLYTSELGVETWEIDGQVLYLVYPEGMDEHFTMKIYRDDEFLGEFNVESSMSWTLEALGIEQDGDYNIELFNDSDERVTDVWMGIWCINGFRIQTWIWDSGEDGELYTDTEGKIISVDIPEDKYGNIIIIINEEEIINWEINDGYQQWNLEDLGMTEAGEYNVTVNYVCDEENETLAETTLNVVEFNYDTFRAIISEDKRRIDFYCPDGESGNIKITVDKSGHKTQYPFVIDDSYWGKWTKFYFNDLGISLTDSAGIKFEVVEKYSCEKEIDDVMRVSIWNGEDERGQLYNDSQGDVIYIEFYGGIIGTLDILLNGEVKFITKMSPDCRYAWGLKELNITGTNDLELRFIFDGNVESIFDELTVKTFENDKPRANLDFDKNNINVFCAEGCEIISIQIYDDTDNPIGEPITYEITSDDYGKWKGFSLEDMGVDYWGWYAVEVNVDEGYSFKQWFMIIEDYDHGPGLDFMDDDGNLIKYDYDSVFSVYFPDGFVLENATINITCGDYLVYKNVTEVLPRWDRGYYYYDFTLKDLDSFETLEDKSVITVTLRYVDHVGDETYYAKESREFVLKNTDEMRIYDESVMDDDWVSVGIAEEMHENKVSYNISSDGDRYFAAVMIPELVHDNFIDGKIVIYSGDEVIFEKYLADFDPDLMGYDYPSLSDIYYAFFKELNLTKAKDKDLISIQFIAETYDGEDAQAVYHIVDDETVEFYGTDHSIDIADDEAYLGNISNLEYITDVTLPDYEDTPGYFSIVCGDRVLFNRTLDEIKQDSTYYKEYSYPSRGYRYYIPKGNLLDDLHDGDVLQFSLVFDGNEEVYFEEKIFENETDKYIKAIISVKDVYNWFGINITDKTLVNVTNDVLNLLTFEGTNRQTIEWKMRGGYFSVYVNGVKVENLGRLLTVSEGEPPINELELFWLCYDPNMDFNLTMDNLGIADNGEYNILIKYLPQAYDPGELEYRDYSEMDVTNLNITLTSNVKTNYQNESVEWLTGYGVDPILMYLDTYYGDINATTGKITVLNSDNVTIFERNIKDLDYSDGRYSLRYSDFENKNFGDKITVKYSDGNERNGTTTLDVKWRDVTPEDFNMTVVDDLNNYYGNFVNMNIPAVITTGQIIVTVKFKNNHNSSISNMNVSTDFDSNAVYTFDVADIHANYENGRFVLSLSDLEFYEIDGDYDVDVKFTGDGSSILPIANDTFDVSLLHGIIIIINESSRYGMEMPFASVQIFEPMNVYAELYVDGERYDRQSFERGLVNFNSFADWTPGTHTAEVRVIDREFQSLLNSSTRQFEVVTQTGGAAASIEGIFNDGDHVVITFTAPKAGAVLAVTEDGIRKTFHVNQGDNQLDIGVLSFGNHTIWVLYNETLDDGSIAYFNDYLSVFVGSWMVLPDPLVLNEDDTIKFKFGEDAEGSVRIIIDNGLLDITLPLVNGNAEFKLDESLFDRDPDHKYGTHTYDITYSGDATHESLSRSGVFEVKYLFKDNIVKEGMPLRKYYDIVVALPGDAKGTVTMVINGKSSTAAVVDGQVKFRVEGLDMAEYPVVMSYSGDERYPASSYQNILNVSYYGVVCDIVDGKRIVSLTLPDNATGDLVVYNDNRNAVLFSKALENGYAEIDLSGLTIGIYELRAIYEGDDYTVRKFTDKFNIYPKVNITQNAIVDEDITILVDLDNSTGYLFMVIDGKHPVLKEIVGGKVSHVESTKGYIKGMHNVTFQYFGDSFDENLFNGYVETFNLLPKPITYNVRATEDGEIIITVPEDMTGTLTIYQGENKILEIDAEIGEGHHVIDGFDISVTIREGTKIIAVDVSKILAGDDPYGSKAKFTVESDSDTYVDFIEDVVFTKKTPVIVAGNLNMVYSSAKKYSVTVYGTNGKVAKGEKVTFLINNKAYGVAYTNANGVASIVISKNPGTYKITAKALKVSITKKLTVTHLLTLKKVKVKKSAKKLVLTATLKKLNGKYLKGKKITFKFNGKKFKAKTNKKGIAKVTVKKAVLKKLKVGKKVKYQATYLKDTVKKSVKVKK